jgi:hypothetical protein
MPVYESLCIKCNKRYEYIQRVADSHVTPECCGEHTDKRIFTPSLAVRVDFPAYESPASGKMITTRKERAEDMAATGCRPWEGQESEQKESNRQKAYAEEKDDAALTKVVEETWRATPESDKKLITAAANGA